jgi:hypothetical protein
MSQAPVPIVSPPEPPLPQTLVCGNCGATLTGEYCAACGQRHEPHVHTVAHFAGEAFESITHADSRVWRTLWFLLAKPGRLTCEFFDGRRAQYLPPFRLYLVISVLFFLVMGVPQDAQIVRVQAEIGPTTERAAALEEVAKGLDTPSDDPATDTAKRAAAVALRKEAAREVASAAAAQTAAKPAQPGSAANAAAPAAAKEENGVTEGVRDFCDQFRNQAPSDNASRNNLRDRCRKLAVDGGRSLAASIVQNLPRAMFIFLPLFAFFMKLMYWRPRRYYVEHLLFLVHNHAFVFLVLALLLLIGRIPYVADYVGWLWFAAIVYMIWYIFRGMRNVYRQGRGLTFAKYLTLGFAYVMTTFVVFLLTAIYSAMMA